METLGLLQVLYAETSNLKGDAGYPYTLFPLPK